MKKVFVLSGHAREVFRFLALVARMRGERTIGELLKW